MEAEPTKECAGVANATPISCRCLAAVLAAGDVACQGADQALFAAALVLRHAFRDHNAAWDRIGTTTERPHEHPDILAAHECLKTAGLAFAHTPARTIGGLAVKLRHIAEDVEEGHPVWFRPLVVGTLKDAERMVAGA